MPVSHQLRVGGLRWGRGLPESTISWEQEAGPGPAIREVLFIQHVDRWGHRWDVLIPLNINCISNQSIWCQAQGLAQITLESRNDHSHYAAGETDSKKILKITQMAQSNLDSAFNTLRTSRAGNIGWEVQRSYITALPQKSGSKARPGQGLVPFVPQRSI